MHASSFAADANGFARYEISRVELARDVASVTTSVFRFLVYHANKLLIDVVGTVLGWAVYKLVKREALLIRSFAHSFRGMRDELRELVSQTGVYPDESIIASTDALQKSLERLRGATMDVIHILRKANENSRVALAFESFEAAVSELQGAIYLYRLVAIGADGAADRTWEEQVEWSKGQVEASVARIGDTSDADIDPELLELAMKAVTARDAAAQH